MPVWLMYFLTLTIVSFEYFYVKERAPAVRIAKRLDVVNRQSLRILFHAEQVKQWMGFDYHLW